ncbi:DUF1735 domain-containing protein [Niabella drilacis]|uniref:BT-3987-like N-terminal domain-containing protein n=1 Tax=Niabella drilacis (strain DSM 25811 / CCM 8410 / CCUG 62505 / LMG 26954 / E90) TaxID=1285928 RepID=A0A1G6JLS8_NIADE|nr:DUF1735 domain-containing protein [Niabella drilacis]SDC19674.1 protein of unknown function [Niabella drilacis]
MKSKIIFIIACISMVLASCDKYNSGIEDPDLYKNVYMPRAADDSTVVAVTRDEASFELGYSASLGGLENAAGDINVSFKVDEAGVTAFNDRYGTNYPLLPAANYSLSAAAAVIRAGDRSTDKLTLTVKSNESLALFKTYILPISIQSVEGGGKILPKYATTYYLVKVGQPEILNLGSNWGGILSIGPKNTVISNEKVSKDILMYLPDDKGFYKQAPLHIGINWDASESFYYVNEKAMMVRNAPYWAGLFRFDMFPENITQNNPKPAENIIRSIADWNTFWQGDFWDKYLITPFGDYLFTRDNGGTLWRQPMFSKINVNRTQVATAFDYTQIVAYPSTNPNALICVNAAGDLWYYPVTGGVPGAGKKVGTGWNVFRKIIVRGNEILALGQTNGLYAIAFDPDKTYFF